MVRSSCFSLWIFVALLVTLFRYSVALQQRQPHQSIPRTPEVKGFSVNRIALRRDPNNQHGLDEASPYCFGLNSMLDLPPKSNILATQVWPSARVAARVLEERLFADDSNFSVLSGNRGTTKGISKFTICELGCGPGLPSVTAAAAASVSQNRPPIDLQVIATDLDEFALDLVNAAAKEQGLSHILSTRLLDLTQAGENDWMVDKENAWIDEIDFFIMSDVFESSNVAIGSAKLTHRLLSLGKEKHMWVFAQTDRAQREVYLEELQRLSSKASRTDADNHFLPSSLKWQQHGLYSLRDRLWLCDVDETLVEYG